MYLTRGMEGGHPKEGEGYQASVSHTYLFSCFVIWCLVLFVETCICVILFNTYARFCLKEFFGTTQREKQLL